jgi:hypothetical protein
LLFGGFQSVDLTLDGTVAPAFRQGCFDGSDVARGA